MRRFFDSNILIYADDKAEKEKQKIAQELIGDALSSGEGVLSTQVLQEFFNIATKKLRVDPAIARRKVQLLAEMDLVQVNLDLILGAIDLHRLHSFSFWDSLIVRTAITAGCTVLVTEDLQHGRIVEGVRIENPFL